MPDGLYLVRAGLHTTVQDEGRWGLQHLGVPVGGALDLPALRRANRLVGNESAEAALEITRVGGAYRAEGTLQVAVTGASFALDLDGQPVPMDMVLTLPPGATLTFGPRRAGARAYLAVRGGLEVPRLLGSRSTWPMSPRRGALTDATRLTVASRVARLPLAEAWPSPPPAERVRVMPGPDAEEVPGAFEALCAGRYRLLPTSTRMACPLDGPSIDLTMPQRSSWGTVNGAVQVLPSGAPVVLLAERQTTGGYPVVAVVITADLSQVAQRAPGDEIRFVPCTRQQAMQALLRMDARRRA